MGQFEHFLENPGSEIKVSPSLEILKERLGHYLSVSGNPDLPPTTSYSVEHNNSLLKSARKREAQ